MEHRNAIRTEALRQGFDACAFAANEPPDPEGRFEAWLEAGHGADMDWLDRSKPERLDPSRKLPGCRGVVVLAKHYAHERPPHPPGTGRVSNYAWGRDYHRALRKPLRRLAQFIEGLAPGIQTYGSIDSGPVLEKFWAERAGLAWIGKNSLALRRDWGSGFFLAVLLTTLDLAADSPPMHDFCGTCRACLDACPTDAILAPRVVDACRCISYHTIENRGGIPPDVAGKMEDWVFGCDICQEVCPWNRKAPPAADPDFAPRKGHAALDLDWLEKLGDSRFIEAFAGTPLMRAKRRGLERNAAIVRRNLRNNRGDSSGF